MTACPCPSGVYTPERRKIQDETLWVQSSVVLEPYTGAMPERVEGNSRKRKRHFPSILGVKKVF